MNDEFERLISGKILRSPLPLPPRFIAHCCSVAQDVNEPTTHTRLFSHYLHVSQNLRNFLFVQNTETANDSIKTWKYAEVINKLSRNALVTNSWLFLSSV